MRCCDLWWRPGQPQVSLLTRHLVIIMPACVSVAPWPGIMCAMISWWCRGHHLYVTRSLYQWELWQWYNTISEFNCSRSDKHKLGSGTIYIVCSVYSVCTMYIAIKSIINSTFNETKWYLHYDGWASCMAACHIPQTSTCLTVLTLLSSSLYLPQLPSCQGGVDNSNNVDWSNSIDLQILTNIHGSSVPSLALNNTLTSPRPHIIIALSQATKQVGLINLGLRFWQSSWLRYVHYRPVYSLYYLSLGNLSSPEAWPQVQSKQLNEHETSNFLASPRHPPTPGQPQFCPLTFCPAHPGPRPVSILFLLPGSWD